MNEILRKGNRPNRALAENGRRVCDRCVCLCRILFDPFFFLLLFSLFLFFLKKKKKRILLSLSGSSFFWGSCVATVCVLRVSSVQNVGGCLGSFGVPLGPKPLISNGSVLSCLEVVFFLYISRLYFLCGCISISFIQLLMLREAYRIRKRN